MEESRCDARPCLGSKTCERAASSLAKHFPDEMWRFDFPCEFVELNEAE